MMNYSKEPYGTETKNRHCDGASAVSLGCTYFDRMGREIFTKCMAHNPHIALLRLCLCGCGIGNEEK